MLLIFTYLFFLEGGGLIVNCKSQRSPVSWILARFGDGICVDGWIVGLGTSPSVASWGFVLLKIGIRFYFCSFVIYLISEKEGNVVMLCCIMLSHIIQHNTTQYTHLWFSISIFVWFPDFRFWHLYFFWISDFRSINKQRRNTQDEAKKQGKKTKRRKVKWRMVKW